MKNNAVCKRKKKRITPAVVTRRRTFARSQLMIAMSSESFVCFFVARSANSIYFVFLDFYLRCLPTKDTIQIENNLTYATLMCFPSSFFFCQLLIDKFIILVSFHSTEIVFFITDISSNILFLTNEICCELYHHHRIAINIVTIFPPSN